MQGAKKYVMLKAATKALQKYYEAHNTFTQKTNQCTQC